MATVYLNDEEIGKLLLALGIAGDSEADLAFAYDVDPNLPREEIEKEPDGDAKDAALLAVDNIAAFEKLRKKLRRYK